MRVFTSSLLRLSAFSVAVASMAPLADAAVGVVRNGVTWAGTYEGDTAALTGSTPAWTVFDVANSSESTDGDIRNYTTTSVAGANSYEFTGATWTGAGTARTAEVRLRVPANGQFEAGDGQGSFIVGMTEAYDFRFFNGSVAYNIGGALGTVATLDTTAFHIYRVVVDQAATPQVSLYIDNNPTAVFTTSQEWFTSAGFDKLVYGDISTGGEAGQLDVDYISWTAGAFAPAVPEPSALALLAIGGATLLRRRK